MIRLLLGVCLCLEVLTSRSQDLFLMSSDTIYLMATGYIQTHGGLEFQSSALSTDLMQKLYTGGKIGVVTKAEINDKLKEENRAGGDFRWGLSYRSFRDTLFGLTDWGLDIAVEHHLHLNSSFSEDLYRIGFEGNAQFVGEQAVFDQSRLEAISYQKFGVGLFNRRNFSGVRISLLNGQQFLDAMVDEANLYTGSTVDSLVLSYQGSIQQSDEAVRGFGSGSGVGVGLDAVFNVPFADGSGFLRFQARDIGVIFWNQQTRTQQADSSWTWTGVNLNDVLDDSEQVPGFPALSDTLYYDETFGTARTWLPAEVEVGVNRYTADRNVWHAGIRVRPDGVHVPQVVAGYGLFTNPQTLVTFTGRIGGYGRPGAGFSLEKRLGGLYLSCAIPDVPAMVMRQMGGWGAHFRLGLLL